MKNAKRFSAVLLAFVMIFAMSFTTFAFDITLVSGENKPTAGHTYDIYQIFTGDLEDGVLANIKYGANYTPDGKATGDLVEKSVLDAITDARAFAKSIVDNDLLTGDAAAVLNEENGWEAKGLDAGYYLVVEAEALANRAFLAEHALGKIVCDDGIFGCAQGYFTLNDRITEEFEELSFGGGQIHGVSLVLMKDIGVRFHNDWATVYDLLLLDVDRIHFLKVGNEFVSFNISQSHNDVFPVNAMCIHGHFPMDIPH